MAGFPLSATRTKLFDRPSIVTRSAGQRACTAKALPLRSLADAVNVTYGAGARAHMGVTAAAAILVQHGIEPILQLACRDRNRIALQGDLLAAADLDGALVGGASLDLESFMAICRAAIPS